MSKQLIRQMAEKAGLTDPDLGPWMTDYGDSENEICKLVAMVAEECAKVAEATTEQGAPDEYCETKGYASAVAIRAKFPMPKGKS